MIKSWHPMHHVNIFYVWMYVSVFAEMTPAEADQNFLANAKRLELYGVDLHLVKDATNTEVQVGISHSGVLLYNLQGMRLNRFAWPKILRIVYKKSSFALRIRSDEVYTTYTTSLFRFLSPPFSCFFFFISLPFLFLPSFFFFTGLTFSTLLDLYKNLLVLSANWIWQRLFHLSSHPFYKSGFVTWMCA